MLSLLSACAARSGTSVRAEVRRAFFAIFAWTEGTSERSREPSERRRASCVSLFRGAAAPQGRAAPLLALSYTGKLRGLSSLRRRAERKLLTGLLCFRLWCGSLLWRRGFFFGYSGAFFEPLFASIHARNLSLGTTIRLPILSAGKLLLRASS